MARSFWLGASLVAGLATAAVAVHLLGARRAPAESAVPPDRAPDAELGKAAPTTTRAAEAAGSHAAESDVTQVDRPTVAYDRYREEMQRQRAAREAAQAVQRNERCISGELFRKVGNEWVQAGRC